MCFGLAYVLCGRMGGGDLLDGSWWRDLGKGWGEGSSGGGWMVDSFDIILH
jgi:hypothetical protein